MVSPAKHAELASHWNMVYYGLKAREERS
jgi:hypothetical protein